jgi:hypothetical protein
MNSEIEPRKEFLKPRPEQISAVTLSGCEFLVGWDDGDARIECVKLGGKWWEVHEVFSSDFCDQLDAALLKLE